MPRRRRAERREIPPDPVYNSVQVSRLINKTMRRGKKTVAQKIVYRALELIREQTGEDPVQVLERAIRNCTPLMEVRPRRVGGATYQVPIDVRPERGQSLAERWILLAARSRRGMPMFRRLAMEIIEAGRGEGAAVKRREDMHRMAEANRAFIHYRW